MVVPSARVRARGSPSLILSLPSNHTESICRMDKPLRPKHTVIIPCDMHVLGQVPVVVWVAAHVYLYRDTKYPEDVHSQHHGQRCRSTRNDVTGLVILPRRIRRKGGRMQISWCRYAESSRKKYFAARYYDKRCFRKCHGASSLS